MANTTTVHWHDAREEKPKAFGPVLMAIRWRGMLSRSCCSGRMVRDVWYVNILGDEIELGDANEVTHWAYFPEVPFFDWCLD